MLRIPMLVRSMFGTVRIRSGADMARVSRILKEASLGIKPRKRFVNRGSKEEGLAVFLNLYRNVIPVVPDRVWVADITFIRIARGFVFLAAILDACSRMVVGYQRLRDLRRRCVSPSEVH